MIISCRPACAGGEIDVKKHETHFLEAAVRELWEETSLDATTPGYSLLLGKDREPIWRLVEWRPKHGTNSEGWTGACDEVLFFVRYDGGR